MTSQNRSGEFQPLEAGSPGSGEPVFLVVGKLRRPHGLHGDMILEVITDFPQRLRVGKTVYVGDAYEPKRIRARRPYNADLLLAFDGYDTPEEAGMLRNELVYVRADELPPLSEGEYYQHQLLGMRVVSEAGEELGRLEQILETGANNVYVVRPESGPEILLPAIEAVILGVDLEQGEVRVHILPGLLPD